KAHKVSGKLGAFMEELRTARQIAAKREEHERLEREREKREAWQSGESVYFNSRDELGAAYLRAVKVERDESGAIVDGTLETSQGASVPLIHALKAFAFVRRVVESGVAWQSNGKTIRVGHFRIDKIESDGTMRAGCHILRYPEMCRVAATIGVDGIASSDEALMESN